MSEPDDAAPEGDLTASDPYDLDAGTSEHYVDAELYDFEYRRRRVDVNHYRELARRVKTGAPVLELACGTGRLLVPLARDGHRVIGMDLSRTMLRRARARIAKASARAASRITLLRGDMTRFALGVKVPLAIVAFNGFQHLYTRSDVQACLASVRDVLAPGGLLALDILNPDIRWLTRDPNRRWSRTKFTHPTTGRKTIYTTNQTYDPVTQIAHIRIYYEEEGSERTHVVRLAHRQFFPAELEALLALGGFRMLERYGGFNGEPFEGDSDSQVLVCRVA